RVEGPGVARTVVENGERPGDQRIVERREPRGRPFDLPTRPAADRRDQEQIDQARRGRARARATCADLGAEEIDYRGDVAAGHGVDRYVDDVWEQAHQWLGHLEVVVVPRADEGRCHARTVEGQVALGRHQLFLHRAIERTAAAAWFRRHLVSGS